MEGRNSPLIIKFILVVFIVSLIFSHFFMLKNEKKILLDLGICGTNLLCLQTQSGMFGEIIYSANFDYTREKIIYVTRLPKILFKIESFVVCSIVKGEKLYTTAEKAFWFYYKEPIEKEPRKIMKLPADVQKDLTFLRELAKQQPQLFKEEKDKLVSM